jgi:hypothetical protein
VPVSAEKEGVWAIAVSQVVRAGLKARKAVQLYLI